MVAFYGTSQPAKVLVKMKPAKNLYVCSRQTRSKELSILAVIGLTALIQLNSSQVECIQNEAANSFSISQILARASLVGAQLAAMPHLLHVLGHNMIHGANCLAFGNHHFWLPGVNISMSEEHGKYQGGKLRNHGPTKTFEALGLPGDYELIQKPFNGSDQLKDILAASGLGLFPSLEAGPAKAQTEQVNTDSKTNQNAKGSGIGVDKMQDSVMPSVPFNAFLSPKSSMTTGTTEKPAPVQKPPNLTELRASEPMSPAIDTNFPNQRPERLAHANQSPGPQNSGASI